MSPSLGRRELLIGAAAGAVAAACGNGDATSASSTTTPASTYQLIVNFPRSDPYAPPGTPQRLPFLIAGPDGAPLDTIDGDVEFQLELDGKRIGEPVTVQPHREGLERAYLPYEVTFPEVGTYDLTATYKGVRLETTMPVVEAASVTLPQVGAVLPPLHTPTLADARGVDPLCTREPACPLHEVDLFDALAAHRPTLLLISTPKYCQVSICGPVLDLLLEATSGRADLAAIHQEVYADAGTVTSITDASLAPLLTGYGMTFEPSLFAIDATGTLVRRLDTIYDRKELAEAIDALS